MVEETNLTWCDNRIKPAFVVVFRKQTDVAHQRRQKNPQFLRVKFAEIK
jgi:hypothetical protein